MPDRESVITHLQIIRTWASFARERDLQFFTPKHLTDIAEWTDDALEMLKKQNGLMLALEQSNAVNGYLNAEIERLTGLLKKQKAVVRCKDCIYWQDNNDGYPHVGCKWREDETPDPDDFCSAGELK